MRVLAAFCRVPRVYERRLDGCRKRSSSVAHCPMARRSGLCACSRTDLCSWRLSTTSRMRSFGAPQKNALKPWLQRQWCLAAPGERCVHLGHRTCAERVHPSIRSPVLRVCLGETSIRTSAPLSRLLLVNPLESMPGMRGVGRQSVPGRRAAGRATLGHVTEHRTNTAVDIAVVERFSHLSLVGFHSQESSS